ncbi:MAG: phosphoribosylamine--glycine ligase [Acidimicrobiia bacterium]|nr:phosphoribosylamine--glycine ligase [Acidimicrobiia bacterium]MDH5504010.1 phosphoribosylamine--glycine ligase [Acidimicrobiia bacterium]
MSRRVLLVGGGGREHAIAWKLSQSEQVSEIMSLPGNPGMADIGPIIEGIDPTDVGAVAAFAKAQGIDLAIIGPEAPLAAGLVDALTARGIRVFGPSRSAARLESSKTFAKQIMDRAGVPTAAWGSFVDQDVAKQFVRSQTAPYVIKADGLAAGKGVLVTEELSHADVWIDECLGGRFGEAQVVIEAFLDGPELSIFAVCDGTDAILLEPARDYKRLRNGDQGPNTGGMGAYSPVDGLPDGIMEFTLDRVVRPVLATMAALGTPYVGFLYVGYVLTAKGPSVLEFNCRLGDPETQVVLARMQTDLVDLIDAALDGRVNGVSLEWSEMAAVNVVLAADGYPDNPVKGTLLKRLSVPDDVTLFHAGTATNEDGGVIAAGGRVLNVVALGRSVDEARTLCYEAVDTIRWPGMQYRSDIARNK